MTHSPRAFPWEKAPPVGTCHVRESTIVRPEGADRARESACAKGVGASTSHGAGTSATARSRIACGRSAAGRRRGGRPNVARTMPRQSPARPGREGAPSASQSLRPRPLKTQKLRSRVVTQQNLFFTSALRSARLPRTPCELAPQPGTLLLPACRQAVRNVQDRERKWLLRGTLDGRKKRSFEYQAARQRRIATARQRHQPITATSTSGLKTPPGRAGRQLSRDVWRLI